MPDKDQIYRKSIGKNTLKSNAQDSLLEMSKNLDVAENV